MTDEANQQLPLRRLNKYRLSAPTGDDFRREIHYAAPQDGDVLWRELFAAAGVEPSKNLLNEHELRVLADVTAAHGGPVGVVGKGLQARVASYFGFAQLDDDINRNFEPSRKLFEDLIRTRVPDLEVARAVDELGLFDPRTMLKLDEVAGRLAQQMRAQMVILSSFVGGAKCLIGSYGIPEDITQLGGLPAEWSFCATVVRRRQPYVVNDAAADSIQQSNPVVKYHAIRAYAGVPLVTVDGVVIGACCIMSGEVQQYDESHVQALQEIAGTLMRDLRAS
jgi:GAF domain-containing protein